MDFAEVKRIVIIAMFSDDTLFNQLVLKGGNAQGAFPSSQAFRFQGCRS